MCGWHKANNPLLSFTVLYSQCYITCLFFICRCLRKSRRTFVDPSAAESLEAGGALVSFFSWGVCSEWGNQMSKRGGVSRKVGVVVESVEMAMTSDDIFLFHVTGLRFFLEAFLKKWNINFSFEGLSRCTICLAVASLIGMGQDVCRLSAKASGRGATSGPIRRRTLGISCMALLGGQLVDKGSSFLKAETLVDWTIGFQK